MNFDQVFKWYPTEVLIKASYSVVVGNNPTLILGLLRQLACKHTKFHLLAKLSLLMVIVFSYETNILISQSNLQLM